MRNFFNIAFFRSRRSMSGRELCLKCGYPTNKISRIENGKIPLKEEECITLGNALNVSPAWFYDSPYVYSLQSALDIIDEAGKFCVSSAHIFADGSVEFPDRISDFLDEFLRKKKEFSSKDHTNSETDFFEYLANYSGTLDGKQFKNEDGNKKISDTVFLVDRIFLYAKQRGIDDFSVVTAMGFDDFFAVENKDMIKNHSIKVTQKNIENFCGYYRVPTWYLIEDYTIRSLDECKQYFIALLLSPSCSYTISEKEGRIIIRFDNEKLTDFLKECAGNGMKPPFYIYKGKS